MNDVAIRVEGLGKSYLIGHEAERERYTALRDVLASSVKRIAASVRSGLVRRSAGSGPATEEFWALRDVSFDMSYGEIVGVIGRNGAGKSTLLKVLSRITEPTQGRITVNGRVASLLEVGTGFHPELTGRENIYLNGAILGMSHAEIRKRFNDIVGFAEVEQFIDTPVKRYSSGMYMRLAFSVAAHIEPEILIVDEVLAVGDAEFQAKCLGKMQEVSRRGRAVLLVSHNMAAVRALCTRAIGLSKGHCTVFESVNEAISQYGSATAQAVFRRDGDPANDPHLAEASVAGIEVDGGGKTWLRLRLRVKSDRPRPVNVDVRITDPYRSPIVYATLGNTMKECPLELSEGDNEVCLGVDVSHLVVGHYLVSFDISKPFVEWYDRVESALEFAISAIHRPNLVQPTLQEWNVGCVEVALRLER